MRFIILVLMLMSAPWMAWAQGSSAARIEYVAALDAPQTQRLLGAGHGKLYVLRATGQVEAVDAGSGATVFQLQNQLDGHALYTKAEAVASSDDTLYLADSEGNRIIMFGLDGKYLGMFGARSGDAALSGPRAVAWQDGLVYVADSGNHRIQVYGDNGVYMYTLPIDTLAANQKLDTQASPYKLDKPIGLQVDPDGVIYVLDDSGGIFSSRSQVKIYGPDGRYLRVLPKDSKPNALQWGTDGLYVADVDAFAVQRYDAQGRLVGYFGSKGDGRAQFLSLTGLVVDGADVYVGDRDRGLIHHFRTSAPNAADRVSGTGPVYVRWQDSLSLSARRLAVDGQGTLVAIARDRDVLVRWKAGVVTELPLQGIKPQALTFDRAGNLWVLDRSAARLHRVNAAGASEMALGSSGRRNGQFDDPQDVVALSDGSLYVADTGNGRIQGFSADGVFFRNIDHGLKDKLARPVAMAVDAHDRLYVLDAGRNTITVYNASGEPEAEFGNDPAREAERLRDPLALVAGADEVMVLSADRVRTYDRQGHVVRTFGAAGGGAGELSQAVAMVARDSTSFYVAEKGEARVQLFSTRYRPAPPLHVEARGAVHGVELKWDASPLAYVSKYAVYRSALAGGPFEMVGVTSGTTFSDANLAPGKAMHYRVVSALADGQEGPWGAVVSAQAQPYVPAAPEGVRAEPGISRVRITWKAQDPAWVKAYVLYLKEGDKYTPLAEATGAELQRDNLNAGTAYAWALAARGVDGIESEKQPVAFSTQADNRAPVELDATQLHNVFSNTYKLYETAGVGTVHVTNNTRSTLKDVKVSFMLNNFMDFPTEQKVDLLEPGASKDVVLKAVFNNNILTLTEDTPVQAKLETSYFENGQNRVYSQIKTISIYDKHRMSWDEKGRYAAFITPKDPLIINFSRGVASEFGSTKEPTQLAAALFDTLGALGVTYVADPINPYQVTSNKVDYVDYVQYPRETLQRRSGDCDDLVALYSAALESMGIPTRTLLVPGHMFMMFSTGIDAPADGFTMNNLYVAHEGMLWIPVETTLVGKSFIKAWENGAATYYRERDKEGFGVFDVSEAWDKFKPASLPDDTWRAAAVNREALERSFPGDLLSVVKISSQTQTRGYTEAIARDPNDANAHLQIGIILARQGDRNEARKYFRRVLELQPRNAAALNDLGNLYMLDSQYADAQKYYADAAKADPRDAEVLINLTQAYKAAKNTDKAREAYSHAVKIDPTISSRYKTLGLELMNTLPTGKGKPAPSAAGKDKK